MEVILQGFNWESAKRSQHDWYQVMLSACCMLFAAAWIVVCISIFQI